MIEEREFVLVYQERTDGAWMNMWLVHARYDTAAEAQQAGKTLAAMFPHYWIRVVHEISTRPPTEEITLTR